MFCCVLNFQRSDLCISVWIELKVLISSCCTYSRSGTRLFGVWNKFSASKFEIFQTSWQLLKTNGPVLVLFVTCWLFWRQHSFLVFISYVTFWTTNTWWPHLSRGSDLQCDQSNKSFNLQVKNCQKMFPLDPLHFLNKFLYFLTVNFCPLCIVPYWHVEAHFYAYCWANPTFQCLKDQPNTKSIVWNVLLRQMKMTSMWHEKDCFPNLPCYHELQWEHQVINTQWHGMNTICYFLNLVDKIVQMKISVLVLCDACCLKQVLAYSRCQAQAPDCIEVSIQFAMFWVQLWVLLPFIFLSLKEHNSLQNAEQMQHFCITETYSLATHLWGSKLRWTMADENTKNFPGHKWTVSSLDPLLSCEWKLLKWMYLRVLTCAQSLRTRHLVQLVELTFAKTYVLKRSVWPSWAFTTHSLNCVWRNQSWLLDFHSGFWVSSLRLVGIAVVRFHTRPELDTLQKILLWLRFQTWWIFCSTKLFTPCLCCRFALGNLGLKRICARTRCVTLASSTTQCKPVPQGLTWDPFDSPETERKFAVGVWPIEQIWPPQYEISTANSGNSLLIVQSVSSGCKLDPKFAVQSNRPLSCLGSDCDWLFAGRLCAETDAYGSVIGCLQVGCAQGRTSVPCRRCPRGPWEKMRSATSTTPSVQVRVMSRVRVRSGQVRVMSRVRGQV